MIPAVVLSNKYLTIMKINAVELLIFVSCENISS